MAACGLAGGMDFPSTVMPFILRGVTLYGIDSVMAPRPLRQQAWARLAEDLDLTRLHLLTREVPLSQVVTLGMPSWQARCAAGSWSMSRGDD